MNNNSITICDNLTPIRDVNELVTLRDLYLRDWPKNSVGFYTLDNFIRWLERDPKIKNLQIFTLNGDWKSDGTFIIVDRYQLFLNSLDTSNIDRVTKALSLLEWSAGYKVSSFLKRHRPAVLSVVRSLDLKLEYDSHTVMYSMPRENAIKLNFECPQDFIIRQLSAKDASEVNDLWPNRHQGSLFFIRRLIAWNENVGVYSEESGELVAWCLRLQGGFLGALQVKDKFKRLGFGSLVTRAISQNIAKMGHDVSALVNEQNLPSRQMFEKIGFQIVDDAYWLRTLPTKEGVIWIDDEN